MAHAIPCCLRFETHLIFWAFCFDADSAGRSKLARMAMMAITTRSSIKVKPCRTIGVTESRGACGVLVFIECVLEIGGAGDPPAPVGDPPTGTAASNVAKSPRPLARAVASIPSGESPDGTGGSPVLPAKHFSNML